MTSGPTVTFIVVNYNGGDQLGRCLDSIAGQTLTDFEVQVFDNGSTDGSLRALERRDGRFVATRLGSNLGFAAANNRAAEVARGRYLALLNNDAWLEPDWAERMVAALEAHPDAGAAACRIVQAANPDALDSAGFDLYGCVSCEAWRGLGPGRIDRGSHRPFGPVAAAAVYRRDAFFEVGGFHDEYFCYYEDTDLAVRLALFGWPTVYVHDAVAHHAGSQTAGDHSGFHVFHLRRNTELLFWVDMVGALAWFHLPSHLAFELGAFGRAVKDGQAGVVLRAKLDAVRKVGWILAERRRLASQLKEKGRWRAGQGTLLRSMRLGLPLAKLVRRRAGES